MRKLLLPFLFLLFIACGPDTRALKETAAEITDEWGEMDDRVNTWTRRLEANRKDFADSLAVVKPTDDLRATWKPRVVVKWDSLDAARAPLMQQFDKLSGGVDGFLSQWTQQSADLTAFREALTQKDIDVTALSAKALTLKQALSSAAPSLDQWNPILIQLENQWPAYIQARREFIRANTPVVVEEVVVPPAP